MTTRAELIVAKLFDQLKAAPKLVYGNVWRSRLRPIPQDADAAIVIRQRDDGRSDESTVSSQYREVTVAVEVYARGDVPDSIADPIVEAVVARMLQDMTLGGLCYQIELGNKSLDWAARDTDLVAVDLDFKVSYVVPDGALL